MSKEIKFLLLEFFINLFKYFTQTLRLYAYFPYYTYFVYYFYLYFYELLFSYFF